MTLACIYYSSLSCAMSSTRSWRGGETIHYSVGRESSYMFFCALWRVPVLSDVTHANVQPRVPRDKCAETQNSRFAAPRETSRTELFVSEGDGISTIALCVGDAILNLAQSTGLSHCACAAHGAEDVGILRRFGK